MHIIKIEVQEFFLSIRQEISDLANPKIFISHASDDKNRFVTGFATRLRENGVDAWVDE